MGCSPSVLLEHIHRDSTANQEKNAKRIATQSNKKDSGRPIIHRKSSLALTPEEEPLDLNCCAGLKEVSSTNITNLASADKQRPDQEEAKSISIIESIKEMGDSRIKIETETKDAFTSIDKEIIRARKKKKPASPKTEILFSKSSVDSKPEKDVPQILTVSEPSEQIGDAVKVKEDEKPPIQENRKGSKLKEQNTPQEDEKPPVNEIRKDSKPKEQSVLREDEKSAKLKDSKVKMNVPLETTIVEKNKSKRNKRHQRGTQEVKYGFLVPLARNPPKLLLVFSHADPVLDTQSRAAEKLGFEVSFSNTEESALEEFQSKFHELVIVDARPPKSIDYNTLCRSIRNTRGSQHVVLVAIVKRSVFEKDDVSITALLDCGFNTCIIENTNIISSVNEFLLLKHSHMQPMAQHATCQSVYAAVDKCKEVVIITDESFKIQYANRACEKCLNIRSEDLIGKTFQEQLAYDNLQVTTMASSLLRGREWNGSFTVKKKNQETVTASCRAIPVSCSGRMPSHFVFVLDTSHTLETVLSQSRGSVHSIRRGSNDVRSIGSDFYRRTSLAKLNALPLEAPITKIIGLIDQARENAAPNTQVVQILEKVEDILRCPELYTPQVKEDRHDEPIVSELITALLSKQSHPSFTISSRRSSNDSSVYRPSKGGVIKVPAALRDLLDTSLSWEFDIFRLEDLTKKRPLQYLGMNLFTHFEVSAILNCDEKTLYNWLIIIEANYHGDNTYHNSTHAADVMQATAGFLEKEKIKSIMDSLDEATSLIAAAAHDVDHPGKSNAFLANSDNPLAILYNDITILESHHAALMFKLTLGDERVNIFRNLDKEAYKIARHNVIDMILATEMTKHFEHLAKFVNVFCTKASNTDIEVENQDFLPISTPENITLIKRMMIKCSDVSNPTRPIRLCVEWARRIAEEYFQQTDEEKERGLPVVMPMFDRHTCSIPKSQIGFVDYIINDMFEAWNAFIDMPELITYMRQNYIQWKEFDEQGLNTLADISKIQSSVLMCPMFPYKPGKSD